MMTRAVATVVGVVVAAGWGGVDVVAVADAPAVVQVPAGRDGAQGNQGTRRNFRATRRIVVDPQTNQARMPTPAEVDELVSQLTSLTARPEVLPERAGLGGAVGADLGGGFGGAMLARPNEDGSFETLCVFTFEEGADFLGLVEVIQ
jgi:hypothetical protein